jgi:hypothetical protein
MSSSHSSKSGVARLTRKKHKWVFCGDHMDCIFFHLAKQLYVTFSPNVLGSFQCANVMLSVLMEAGGAVDVMSVGLVIVVKEETIRKRSRKEVRNFGQFFFKNICINNLFLNHCMCILTRPINYQIEYCVITTWLSSIQWLHN